MSCPTTLIQLLVFSILIGLSIQMSTLESQSYVAGVVEYKFYQDIANRNHPELLFDQNTDTYIKLMNSTNAASVDIIVFPESCLNSYETAIVVPSVQINIDLCTANKTFYNHNLRKLACAARDLKKYVVINLYRKDCLHGGCSFYSINVVFDRKGTIISIHRRYNSFEETYSSEADDFSTFSTDFGVKFGHFTSDEILFQSPALDLVARGIENIIFPTKWFSELPFLSAVSIQQNWAYSNNVNFLAAGVNYPQLGNGGSGIYSGKLGALTSIMTGEETTRLLVHEVPKTPGTPVKRTLPAYSGNYFDNLKLNRDQLDVYSFHEVRLPGSTAAPQHDSFTLCHGSDDILCCDFEIDVALRSVSENSVSYTYMAAVFSGDRSFDKAGRRNIKTCAILACKNSQTNTCGIRYNEKTDGVVKSNIEFEKILVRGIFPNNHSLTLPNSLNFDISPYPTSDFSYVETVIKEASSNQSAKEVIITLLAPKTDLFTFGIYGLSPNSTSTGTKLTSSIVVLLNVFIFTITLSMNCE